MKSFLKLLGGACLILSCDPQEVEAGRLIAWGGGAHGQHPGTNDMAEFKSVSAGAVRTLALKSDGTMQGWGYGPSGGLLYNVLPLSNVVAVACGENLDAALLADGSVVSWDSWNTNRTAPTERFTSIAVGRYHWLGVRDNGTVAGYFVSGNVAAYVPSGIANVKAVAAGGDFSLALQADGKIIAWGFSSEGQTAIPASASNVVAIAAGTAHGLALRNDGTVIAWGRNSTGQANVPAGLSDVVTIAAGENHSLALTADGKVVAWGNNQTGQTNVPSLSRVTALAAARFHSVALTLDGPIEILQNPTNQSVPLGSNAVFSVVVKGQEPLGYQWYFGTNALVDGGGISRAASAALQLENVPYGSVGEYYVAISNAFGVVTSARAWLTLLTPPTIDSRTADQIVGAGSDRALSVGVAGTRPLSYQWEFEGQTIPNAINHSILLTNLQTQSSGTYSVLVTNLYGWVRTNISLVVTDTPPVITRQPYQMPNQQVITNFVVPQGGSVNWSVVARGSLPISYQWRLNGFAIPGATNSTFALNQLTTAQDGIYNVEVRNAFGAVLSGKVSLRVVQAQVFGNTVATNVPPDATNIIALAASTYHVMGIRTDGSLVIWGDPRNGAGVTNVPPGGTNIVEAACGNRTSMMALRKDGRVFLWGQQMPSPPAGATNGVMAIAHGGAYQLVLKTNGTIIAWGSQAIPELSVPPALSNNVVAIAAGGFHNLTIQTDGRVRAWGRNNSGQTNVPAILTNAIAIAAGESHSLALRADGRVTAWGGNSLAIDVPAMVSNVVAIAAGYNSSAALRSDGVLITWGNLPLNSPAGGGPGIYSNVVAMAISRNPSGPCFLATAFGVAAPVFTIHPVSQSASNGARMQLHARAVGAQPMSFQWYRNGILIPGGTNASLTIPNFHGQNAGTYSLVASNRFGNVTSRAAAVNVPFSGSLATALNVSSNIFWTTFSSTSKVEQVWFAQNVESMDRDGAAQSGAIGDNQTSTLQTSLTAPGTLTFWWKVSSEQQFDYLRFEVDGVAPFAVISGEVEWQKKTVAIPAGTHTVRWIYSKDATLSVGRDAAWVDHVEFLPSPPAISQEPANQIAVWGGTVTFSVSALGTPPLQYQWLRNGTNFNSLAASQLTLTNVSRMDAGLYAVRISNPGGSVLSTNANLRVRIPQQLDLPEPLDDWTIQVSSRAADGLGLDSDDLEFLKPQFSTNLIDWIDLAAELELTNGTARFVHTNDAPLGFYRVMEE